MKHADVKEALDLADEEVSKESKRIRRIGGERAIVLVADYVSAEQSLGKVDDLFASN